MNQSDIIYEIKERLDIVDIIGEYVTLKRAGQNYKGLCPFHSEKTPSFTVNPTKQIFYCFGCQKGGDVINFLMSYNNLSFNEAINNLSERAGLKIERLEGAVSNKDIFYKANKIACDYFKTEIKSHKKALDYFHKRGIDDKIIDDYELGYSPQGRDSLFRHLINKGLNKDDIFKTALVNKSKDQIFDFFRDRIMFPIIDNSSRVIAFGGRRLSDNPDIPKYINSAESPIFKKGDTLFGLNKARSEITKKDYSILVEGYMDVLACHQYGFLNAIAPLGTAITTSHLKKLKKLSNNVVFLFDGDNAGINAAKRAIEMSFTTSLMVKVVILPTNEDPDSLLRKKGEKELKNLLSKALSPVTFYYKLFGKNVVECTRNLLHLLLLSEDILHRELYLKEIAEKTKMSELTLRQEFNTLLKKKNNKSSAMNETSVQSKKQIQTDRLDEYLLRIMILNPSFINRLTTVNIEYLEDPIIKGIIDKIRQLTEKDVKDILSNLLFICDDAEKELLTKIAVESPLDDAIAKEAIDDCLFKIAMRSIDKHMKDATESGNLSVLNKLIEQKRALSIEHEKI